MQGKDQLEDSQNQLILFVRIHLTLFSEIQIYLSLERASWLHGKFIQIRIYRYHIFTHKDIITFCMFAKKKKSNISWRSLIHRKDQVWQIWPLADFFHLEEKPVQPKLNRHIAESFLKFRLMFNAIFFFWSDSVPQFRIGDLSESNGGDVLFCALQRECVALLTRQFCESRKYTLH